jgi:hypothetical protein
LAIVRVALGLGVGLAIAYLVGMNAFLGTRWFRNAINFSPEQFRIEYSRAYSIVPGHIRVEGLNIRGSDGAVEWILKLDRCDFHVEFLDLLHRRFHADHVRGSGLSMRLRLRLTPEEVTPEVRAALPPVPGFSDPPYLEIGPPSLPPTDAKYNLWSVQLDDVDAQHVHEIWIHTLRYAGDMRVRGRWLFRPTRWLDIGPAIIDVSSLDVSYGPASPLLRALHGTVEATVHPFDLRRPTGLEILEHVSVKTWLSGSAETAELLDTVGSTPSVKLTHGEAPLDVWLIVDHGALRPGSQILVSSSESYARARDLSIHARMQAELHVESEGERPVAHVDVGLSNLRVVRGDAELARAASATIRLESRDVDLAKPSIETASFVVDLQGAQAPTVAFLQPLLPAGVAVDSGMLHADGYLEGRLADESARGQLGFTLRDLAVARGTNRLRANAQGTLKLESGSIRDGKLDLTDSRIALADVAAAIGGLELRAPSVGLQAIRAAVGSTEPPELDIHVDLPSAELLDLREALAPGGVFSVEAGRGSASVHMDVDVSSLSASGNATLVARGLRVKVGSDTYQGELSVALKAQNLGANPKSMMLSGSTLAFASGGAPSTDDWWARVSLDDAELQLAGGVRFRAMVHATAENASPAQAILARVTPVPRWVLDAFRMDDLHADGEIRETPTSFEAHSIVARGSGNRVQLEYAKHDTDKQGMALLSAGSLRLGFTLAGAGKAFQIFGGEGEAETWFGHQVAMLRARAGDL